MDHYECVSSKSIFINGNILSKGRRKKVVKFPKFKKVLKKFKNYLSSKIIRNHSLELFCSSKGKILVSLAYGQCGWLHSSNKLA